MLSGVKTQQYQIMIVLTKALKLLELQDNCWHTGGEGWVGGEDDC